jgi:hypothetical protein
MFNIGTTVSVINSTVKKDHTGPRKDSIGYATAKGRVFFVQFEKEGIEAATDPTSILFTRYGNDSTTRKELKGFVNVVPVLSKWTEDSEKTIRDFVNSLSVTIEGEWPKIKDYMMINKTASVGVAVPVLGTPLNLRKCHNDEYTAWFDVFLKSHNVLSILNEMSISNKTERFLKTIDKNMLSTIRDMANSKSQKASIMPLILENETHRISVSNILVGLLATVSSVENKRVLATFERGLQEGAYSVDDFQRKGEFVQTLMYDYYTPMFNKKVSLVEKYAEKRQRMLANALLRTRDILLSLVTVGQVTVPVAAVAGAGTVG